MSNCPSGKSPKQKTARIIPEKYSVFRKKNRLEEGEGPLEEERKNLDDRTRWSDIQVDRSVIPLFETVQNFLAGLLDRMPADVTLFVLSDHGAGPLQAYFHLDNWLAEQGWLCFAEKSPRLAFRRRGVQLAERARKELSRLLHI